MTEIKEGAIYRIINVHSGKALEVKDHNCEDGVNVRQWEYPGEDGKVANKLWMFSPDVVDTVTYYQIKSVDCYKKILEIRDHGCDDGFSARIWHMDNRPRNKQWRLLPHGEYYKISPRHCPSKVLEIEDHSEENGANVQLWEDDDHNNKLWNIEQIIYYK